MIVILYGVHGDETEATEFVSKELEEAIRRQAGSLQIIRIGPLSKWSSRHKKHFDRDGSDPNRANTRKWERTEDERVEKGADAIRKEVERTGHIDGDQTRSVLNSLKIRAVDVMRRAQTQRNDFPCYVSKAAWNQAKRKRRLIQERIEQLGVESELGITIVDVHAGIGSPGEITIAWNRARRERLTTEESGYLAEGLLNDIANVQRSIILEVGTIGTKEMEKQILNELIQGEDISKKQMKPFGTENDEEWRRAVVRGTWKVSREILKMDPQTYEAKRGQLKSENQTNRQM